MNNLFNDLFLHKLYLLLNYYQIFSVSDSIESLISHRLKMNKDDVSLLILMISLIFLFLNNHNQI